MYELYGGFGNYLGTYPTLNFHYDAPSYTCYYNSDLSQQCCSVEDMRNRWQTQQTINSLQTSLKNIDDNLNNLKQIKEDIKVKDNIKDYMNKEFLYESELKEIEDEFHFKFYDLFRRLPEQDGILYKISKKIVEELNLKNNSKNLYVREIRLNRFYAENQIRVFFNEDITNELLITVDKSDWKKLVGKDMNYLIEIVIRMCNMLIRQEIPEYQKFYEKYKNRIVKDNEYEDLSYYEKILKENS